MGQNKKKRDAEAVLTTASASTVRGMKGIMGFTMLIQQKLTPNVSMDKTQQKIMNWLPAIFTFMFAGMPAGLVLYWSCSNVFSIIQQSVLLKLVNKNTK